MKLLRKSEGEWFEHPGGAKFLIRPIPNAKAKEIDVRNFGKKRTFEFVKGVQRTTLDMEALAGATREKACFALLDTEGADLDVPEGTEEAFKAKAGSVVVLDKNWTPEIKAAVFAELPELADWVVGKAATFRAKTEDEEGKGDGT